MAKSEDIEARLWRWAEAVKAGGGVSGYPVMCVLSPDWSPPSQGMTPTMKVAPANDARQTHRYVRMLSERRQATLVAHYVKRLTHAAAAEVLGCRADTVKARIEVAQQALARLLGADERGLCNIHCLG